MRLLQNLRHGTLTLQLPDRSMQRFGKGDLPHATLNLHNWKVCAAALKSGDIGFAESFIAGDWSTPNLVDLLRVLVRNRAEVESVIYGTWAGRLLYRVKHLLNRNTRANSQKNIHAHYDLGNAFYRLWLDETMNYSSALFNGDYTQTMGQAQKTKVRRALDQARVKAGDRVLEIGCGWGALAERAVERHDVIYTGITLSPSQAEIADARRAAVDLSARSRIELCDYRDARGPYDAIASVEMVEAVGQAYWPAYLDAVARLLRPGGRAAIQYILINDALFERYAASSDFIQAYIFPGGCLISESRFRALAEARGLAWRDVYRFGEDYAETLRQWRERFDAAVAADQLPSGFDDRFVRLWRYYLQYCEGGFRGGGIDVAQVTLEKTA